MFCCFFFSSRRRHTRYIGDWSSDVCSSDLRLSEKTHGLEVYAPRSILCFNSYLKIATSKRKIIADDGQVTSATHLTLRQSIIPCLLVTILFFLWGFAYGLLDFLTPIFKLNLISPPLRRPGE